MIPAVDLLNFAPDRPYEKAGRPGAVADAPAFARNFKAEQEHNFPEVTSERSRQNFKLRRLCIAPLCLTCEGADLPDETAEHSKAKVPGPVDRRAPAAVRRTTVPDI